MFGGGEGLADCDDVIVLTHDGAPQFGRANSSRRMAGGLLRTIDLLTTWICGELPKVWPAQLAAVKIHNTSFERE
jgi:hypothetical protein